MAEPTQLATTEGGASGTGFWRIVTCQACGLDVPIRFVGDVCSNCGEEARQVVGFKRLFGNLAGCLVQWIFLFGLAVVLLIVLGVLLVWWGAARSRGDDAWLAPVGVERVVAVDSHRPTPGDAWGYAISSLPGRDPLTAPPLPRLAWAAPQEGWG